MKRGDERDHRDLFATGLADLGSVKQTRGPTHAGGVAARNETSVLFTVDALRGNARVKTPEPEISPFSTATVLHDDDGIIDLNALASSPAKVGHRAMTAPFASDPPPAAFVADISDFRDPAIALRGGFRLSKGAMAGIAAAVVAAVLCSVGLAATFKGEEPVARRAAATMIAAPPAMTTPTPAPAPPLAPVVASSSKDDDAQSPSVGMSGGKKGKSGKARNGGAKASFAITKVQSSGVPISGTGVAKTVPKASDKCGCKGDFNCILRCTATGK